MHYELVDTINDMRIDGRRLKYTGDQMELVIQFYEHALRLSRSDFVDPWVHTVRTGAYVLSMATRVYR